LTPANLWNNHGGLGRSRAVREQVQQNSSLFFLKKKRKKQGVGKATLVGLLGVAAAGFGGHQEG
jgi:hypothetical protein